MQTYIRIDDSDERDVGKIQTLRNHLGSNQDVDLAGSEFTQHLGIGTSLLHGVGIHPGNLGTRKGAADPFLHTLGSDSRVTDAGITALRAPIRGRRGMAAEMAGQSVFIAMVRHR